MEENLSGILTGENFKFVTRVWRGKKYQEGLTITYVNGWRVFEWDKDESGGPGLYLLVEAVTPKGKSLPIEIIIPKDELIKALALLVEG